MPPILQRIMANKHTSGAGLVYIICVFASRLGTIWFPDHKVQFDQTVDLVKEMAVGYGFVMSSDSQKKDGDDSRPAVKTNGIKTLCLFLIGGLVAWGISQLFQ